MATTVKLGGLPIEKFSADHKRDEITWRSWSDKLETVGSEMNVISIPEIINNQWRGKTFNGGK